MIFSSNEELEFLNYFDIANDVASGNAKNKLQIISEKGKTYFSLFSNEMILISKIDKAEQDSEIIIDVDDFYSVVKNAPSKQVLSLDKNTLRFGETTYTFELHPIVLPEYKEYLETLSKVSPTSSVALTLNNNFAIALDFVGERDTSCVEYVNNHFVATNKVKACLLSDTVSSINDHLIFSPVLCNFLQKAKLKQVSIDIYNSSDIEVPYYVIVIGNTYIISPIPNQKLPNLFDSKYISMYTHSFKVEANKNDILDALKRMKIVTKFDSQSRAIEFLVSDGKLIFKADTNEHSASAVETISAIVDSDLNGFYSRFNSAYLSTILGYIGSDRVKIFLSNNANFLVAKITDMDERNLFLLTRLHTN